MLPSHLLKQLFLPRSHALVIAPPDREREFVSQALLEFFISIGKLDRANSLIRRGDQHAPERRISTGVANRSSNRATPVFVGSHAKLRRRTLIKAAAGAVPGVIHGARDRMACAKIAFELIHAARIRVSFGRDPQHGLKVPLEMERALMEFAAKLGQCQRLIQMLFDIPADRPNECRAPSVRGTWTTTQTGAITGFLRVVRALKKSYILTTRSARRA